ncbi:MAG: hypothetical protein GXY76_07370 [Chloroflexi bacterium]|nr:hypothetical protein [Chloroflexota bacterium]
MPWNHIRIIRRDPLCTMVLKRPDVMNALNTAMLSELQAALDVMTALSGSIRVLIFTGDGDRAFSVGADINDMAAMTSEDFEKWLVLNQKFFDKIAALEMPTIAALNGYTLGGGLEFALACDLRIAKVGAKLGLPEAKLGVIPGTGGTQRLTRLVGPGIAKDLIFTGRRVTAEEAMPMGLVNRVVPEESWAQGVEEYAKEIAANAPISVRGSKVCINAALTKTLEEGYELERRVNMQCFKSHDFKEGVAAFKEKRPAVFHCN